VVRHTSGYVLLDVGGCEIDAYATRMSVAVRSRL